MLQLDLYLITDFVFTDVIHLISNSMPSRHFYVYGSPQAKGYRSLLQKERTVHLTSKNRVSKRVRSTFNCFPITVKLVQSHNNKHTGLLRITKQGMAEACDNKICSISHHSRDLKYAPLRSVSTQIPLYILL